MKAKIPQKSTRALHERLKTAKKRTVSSQAWLERQINDPYVRAAKSEGYRSRLDERSIRGFCCLR